MKSETMRIKKVALCKTSHGIQYENSYVYIPFFKSLLQNVCEKLNVSHTELLIVGLEKIVPYGGKDNQYYSCLDQLELESQKIFDSGFIYKYDKYRFLMAASSTKASTSFLLSSNAELVDYFQELMTHPVKSQNHIRISSDIPLISNESNITGRLNILIVEDEFNDSMIDSGAIMQCIGNDNGNPKWELISQWENSSVRTFDTRQSVANVGDCHVKISEGMAKYLVSKNLLKSSRQGCQFSLLVHDHPAMAKGTFVVSNEVPYGYHMVIPKSAFELGYSNLPYIDGTYTITLAVTTPSVENISRFGKQFGCSILKNVLEARKPFIQKLMRELNAAGQDIYKAAAFFNNELLTQSNMIEEGQISAKKDDWLFKVCKSLVDEPTRLEWALKDPTISWRMTKDLASRKIKLATGLGFIGQILTPLPDDTLPLHVISGVHAPLLIWRESNWYDGNQLIPHNAVGMVSSGNSQYVGMLTVRGKYPIINHSEQCMAVYINRPNGIGDGCEFMSHYTASICNLRFNTDRNEKLVWKDETGYIEAINHFVELMRDFPISKSQNKNAKNINLRWGKLIRIIYENNFELACKATIYLYSIATNGKREKFKAMIPMIYEVSNIVENQFGDKKYVIEDYKPIKATLDNYIKKYHQVWFNDLISEDIDDTPYINRKVKLSKFKADNIVEDCGTIAESIRFVNSLHENPKLMDEVHPTSRLQKIWGSFNEDDKKYVQNFKSEIKADRAIFNEQDIKKKSVYWDYLRSEGSKFTNSQFSAFWDLHYSITNIKTKNIESKQYVHVCNRLWIMFSDAILKRTPELSSRPYLVSHRNKLSPEIIGKIHTAFRKYNDTFKMSIEITEDRITMPNKDRPSTEYRMLKSIQIEEILGCAQEEILGYIPVDFGIEPSIWKCEFTPSPSKKKSGEYNDTYNIRLICKDFLFTATSLPTNRNLDLEDFESGDIPIDELFNSGDEEYWRARDREWIEQIRSDFCSDNLEDEEDIDE